MSMRAKKDEIGGPADGGVNDGLADIAGFDDGIHLVAIGAKRLDVTVHEGVRFLGVFLEFGSIVARHLRDCGANRKRNNVEDADFDGFWFEISRDSKDGGV